ncbi:MAG: hypothetical protein AAB515_03710 [Patescibacteria group bacterium]
MQNTFHLSFSYRSVHYVLITAFFAIGAIGTAFWLTKKDKQGTQVESQVSSVVYSIGKEKNVLTNTNYRYSISIPASWTLEPFANSEVISFLDPIAAVQNVDTELLAGLKFTIAAKHIDPSVSLQTLAAEGVQDNTIRSQKAVVVDGQEAIRTVSEFFTFPFVVASVKKGNVAIQITGSVGAKSAFETFEEEYNKTLSSFNFY